MKSTCLFSSLKLCKSLKYSIRPYFLVAKRRTIGKIFLNDQRSHNICPLTDSGADGFYSFAEWGFLLSLKGVPAVAGDRVGTVRMQIWRQGGVRGLSEGSSWLITSNCGDRLPAVGRRFAAAWQRHLIARSIIIFVGRDTTFIISFLSLGTTSYRDFLKDSYVVLVFFLNMVETPAIQRIVFQVILFRNSIYRKRVAIGGI